MAKLHIKNTDGTFTPYSTIAVTNLDIVQGKGNSLTSAMSQKAITDEFGTIQDAIASIVNAGYVFAGVATPSTNPGTPEAKVFYIADGKGTYTNFGGIEVTEDEVVILYYDTAWHKEATGIASQEKLTELDTSINGIQEIDISDFSSFTEYDVQILSNGNLTSVGSPKSLLIPVKGGRTYRIKGAVTGARSLYFSCFTDDNMVSGTTANVCPDFVVNNNKRSELGVNEEVVQTMPKDCRFLYVSKVIGGITCLPQWIRSEGVDGLRQDIEKTAALQYNYMPLGERPEIPLTIDPDTLKWTLRNASCYIIPVTNANLVRLVGITPYVFTYAFLKSFDNTEGASVDFCSGTSLINISKGLDITKSIPSDCKFIYVLNKSNGLDIRRN